MQVELTQLISLVSYGNAFLMHGYDLEGFYPGNSAFQYCNQVRFVCGSKRHETEHAANPVTWLKRLADEGYLRLRLECYLDSQKDPAQHTLVAFAGGGSWRSTVPPMADPAVPAESGRNTETRPQLAVVKIVLINPSSCEILTSLFSIAAPVLLDTAWTGFRKPNAQTKKTIADRRTKMTKTGFDCPPMRQPRDDDLTSRDTDSQPGASSCGLIPINPRLSLPHKATSNGTSGDRPSPEHNLAEQRMPVPPRAAAGSSAQSRCHVSSYR